MTSDPPEAGRLGIAMVRTGRGRPAAVFKVLAFFNAELPSLPLTEMGGCPAHLQVVYDGLPPRICIVGMAGSLLARLPRLAVRHWRYAGTEALELPPCAAQASSPNRGAARGMLVPPLNFDVRYAPRR